MKIKPFKKKPDLKQRFSSGNQVEVYVREVAPKFYDTVCEWDSFPPSPKDKAEYLVKVVPRYHALVKRLQAQNN